MRQDVAWMMYKGCCKMMEEKILALQQSKQMTADVFNLNGGKLTVEELRMLMG